MTSPQRLIAPALMLMLAPMPLACDPADMDTAEPPPPGRGRGPGPGAGPGADIPAGELAPRVRMLAARFDVTPTPAAPPVDDAMWALGQALAFDKILSGNGDLSCMTCHHPSIGSDDDRSLPLGVGGEGLGSARTGGDIIPRNAPALYNLHAYRTMFWDSRVERRGGELQTPAGAFEGEVLATLEGSGHGLVSAQAMFPVTSREEMRGHPGENELADLADEDVEGIWAALMARLQGIPGYPAMFEAAYPGVSFETMTFAHAANAIAAFEVAAFESRGSPWERFLAGDDAAMSEAQLRGAAAFFGRGCASCHRGVGLSDFRAHNVGMPQFGPGKGDGEGGLDDFGRAQVTGDEDDRYAFRTTPLTNVEFTAPYGHTGQFATLRRHIEHYADPEDSLLDYDIREEVSEEGLWALFVDNADDVLDDLSPRLRDVRLRDDDPVIDALVVFMQALSDPDAHDVSWVVPETVPSGLPVRD